MFLVDILPVSLSRSQLRTKTTRNIGAGLLSRSCRVARWLCTLRAPFPVGSFHVLVEFPPLLVEFPFDCSIKSGCRRPHYHIVPGLSTLPRVSLTRRLSCLIPGPCDVGPRLAVPLQPRVSASPGSRHLPITCYCHAECPIPDTGIAFWGSPYRLLIFTSHFDIPRKCKG
jgi:hypothetical protein